MEMNIILAGVGGQGVLSIAFVLDSVALKNDFFFKQAEVHGMAQRGGAVESHLRFSSSPIWSDIIPSGEVDMILSVEPLEVLRYIHQLKPTGSVISSINPYVNIEYPDLEGILDKISTLPCQILVDTKRLAKLAGSMKSENIVILGAASSLLPFKQEDMLEVITSMFIKKGQQLVDTNHKAFNLGKITADFYVNGIKAGIEASALRSLLAKLDPNTLEPEAAFTWAKKIDKLPLEEVPGTVEYVNEL